MSDRVDLVVHGDVLVAARDGRVERAEAVAIGGGRVVAVGRDDEIRPLAAAGARVVDARGQAVVPGLHDFHVHLVGLARSRAGIVLDDAADGAEVVRRIADAAAALPPDAWLTGRGWSEAQLASTTPDALEAATHGRPAFLSSHDGHSAWASAAARAVAGVEPGTDDPPGGRIERDGGAPTGVLRETALELVAAHVPELAADELWPHLDATLRELTALGITGATEAGDYTDENGIGADAALGDSASTLLALGDRIDGRLRLSVGIPADAIAAAAERGLRTGGVIPGRRTMRFGWAKEYADGALGSGTAALFEPATCGDGGVGILRLADEELDALIGAARAARIGIAVHAIGDRAAATVLDALARAPARPQHAPSDRMEHLQLLRPADRQRLAQLGITASVQPIHAAADRDLVERCWNGRQADAYAWRALRDAGVALAAGSDAPVESVDPWLGLYAALHRRLPGDARGDWWPSQALTPAEALEAYTIGPARAIGARDEGHLGVGARADLAVLSIGLDALLEDGFEPGEVRSVLTLVDGAVVHDS